MAVRHLANRIARANAIGRGAHAILDALEAPRPEIALARTQLLALREAADEMLRELDVRESSGLKADDVVVVAARTYRAHRGVPESNVRHAALLARALDACAHLANGHFPARGFDPEEIEATRVAIRAHGVGPVALASFAIACPDLATRIDRDSLNRLVTAWTAVNGVPGGRWSALVDVWKRCLGIHLTADSVQREVRRLTA